MGPKLPVQSSHMDGHWCVGRHFSRGKPSWWPRNGGLNPVLTNWANPMGGSANSMSGPAESGLFATKRLGFWQESVSHG